MANKTPTEKLEIRILNNVSQERDPRVKLGDKLEDMLKLDVPFNESFPKSVHDIEDHTGLPGVPTSSEGPPGADGAPGADGLQGIQGPGVSWKAPVANAAGLPGAAVSYFGGPTNVAGYGVTNLSTDRYQGGPFLGKGEGSYIIRMHFGTTGGGVFQGRIYTKVAGKPGTLVATSLANWNPSSQGQIGTFSFSSVILDDNVEYMFVVYGDGSSNNVTALGGAGSAGNFVYSSNGTTWTISASMWGFIGDVSFISLSQIAGDTRLQLDTGQIKRWSGSAWVIISDITGLLNESSHDVLDHAGLTGIPSGILNEALHDVLDHDGLPGVGDHQWKTPVANAAALSLPSDYDYNLSANAGVTGFTSDPWRSGVLLGKGRGTYKVKLKWTNATAGTYEGFIYTNVAGKPGTLLGTAINGVTVDGSQFGTFNFNEIDLTLDATYHIVVHATGTPQSQDLIGNTSGGISCYSSNGTTWTSTAYSIYRTVTFSSSLNGDIRLTIDTNLIYSFNGIVWNKIGDKAANQAASSEATTPTVTEFNALLSKLKTAGLMVVD